MSQQNMITVLLIEDNPGDARLVQLLLDDITINQAVGYKFRLLLADKLATGFEQLSNEAVDVILLDLSLPDSHGLETFKRVHAYAPQLPTILLTGLDDETIGFEAVQAGAQDYLIKGEFDLEILQRVILYAIERQSLLTQLEEQTLVALQSEARFQTMIEHNADGIVIVDRSGLVRFVNPAAERLFGRTIDELLDQPLDVPLDTEERTEIDIERPDGRSFVAEMRVVETEWENGAAFLISLRDMTERKQIEDALSESEARYRSLIETSPDAITLTDLEGQVLFSNQQTANLHGFDRPQEVIGQYAYEFIVPEERPRAVENAQKTLEQGMIRGVEYTMLKQDGSRFPAELSASLIKDNAGYPRAFIGVVRDITARKKAAQELQHQKDLLQSILDNMTEGVVVADDQGKFILFNPAAERIIGRDPANLHPNQWSEQYGFYYPDGITPYPSEELPLFKAIRGQTVDEQELLIRHKDQPEGRFIYTNARPLQSSAGVLQGGLAVFYDITDRKRVEQAIKQRNRELSLLNKVIAASANVIEKPEAVLEIACRELVPTLGVSRSSALLFNAAKTEAQIVAEVESEDISISLGQIIPVDPVRQHLIIHQKLLVVNDVLQEEKLLPYHDQFRQYGVRSLLILPLIVAGDVWGALALTGTEPSDFPPEAVELARRVAEQAAGALERQRFFNDTRRRTEELEALTNISAALRETLTRDETLSIIVDQNLEFFRAEGAALALRERDSQMLRLEVVRGPRTHIAGWQIPPGQGISSRVIESRKPYVTDNVQHEPELFIPDEFSEAIAMACVPLFAEGRIIGVFWVSRQTPFSQEEVSLLGAIADIAANAIHRATLFEQLQQANADLDHERALLAQRVEERTAALQNANVELARAARLKDEFLANMSHELRTPLNAILGMSEVLQIETYGSLNPDQLNAILHIEQAGNHLLSLINDILDLSKIGAGKLELSIARLSVPDLCQASLQFIKQPALKKKIKLSLRLEHTIDTIVADERRLKQILVNLLSNAVKFTPEEGRIGLDVESDDAGLIHFTVWDTGIGFDEGDVMPLFQPFVQLDGALNRQHEGTGLGLALVHQLTELHQGRISVESEVGQGSRFTVSIPLEPAQVDKKKAGKIEPEGGGATENGTTPGQTAGKEAVASGVILLAEDHEPNIKAIRDFLRFKGYEVIVARNGVEAVARAKKEQPDLILMDIQMPEMDGLEAIEQLRSEGVDGEMPIIALTSLAMPGDRERCLAAGANDYLSKPVRLQALVEMIEANLQKVTNG